MIGSMPPLRVEPHAFTGADLCAGHVVLDFVNTAAGLNRNPRDWLDSYSRLLDWSALAGIGDDGLRAGLRDLDRAKPESGRRALAAARDLRAALHALLHASHRAQRLPIEAVAELQRWCRRGGAALSLQALSDGTVQSNTHACGLDTIAVEIALAAASLLSQPIGYQLGVCGGRDCGWLFVDTSKSRRRRWCDMRTCGNAAKAGRHYERHKARTGEVKRSAKPEVPADKRSDGQRSC